MKVLLLAASLLLIVSCAPRPAAVVEHGVLPKIDPSPAYAAAAFVQAIPETTTTTTAPRARRSVRTASVGAAAVVGGHVNGYPCGGDLPPCYVLARESGGNPTAQNPRSTASGLWQFLDSTWANYGGYAKARLAPPDVQNEKARLTWAGGAGCFHWSAC